MSQPIPGSYRILEQRSVQRDGRTITYYRITPPQMSVVPTPAPAELSAEELALAQSRAGKAHAMLSVGATVFDHNVTEIHWTTPGTGTPHKAYSNIDFNLLAGTGTFDSADTVYSLMLAVGNATRAEQPSALVPPIADFPADLSVYFISPTDTFTAADEAILSGLDTLHAYYDANRARIQQAHAEREKRRIVQEQWRRDHPPVPKDEKIYIWRKQPAATSTQGGAQ